jgi:hypothetical protein
MFCQPVGQVSILSASFEVQRTQETATICLGSCTLNLRIGGPSRDVLIGGSDVATRRDVGTRAPSWRIDADRASSGMMTRMSDGDNADVGRAPICPSCGVTALPAQTSNVIDSGFMCENPDCDAFGDAVES